MTFSALRIRPLGWAVLLLAALLLTSACGRSEKIVFEGYGPAEERPPYTPIAQSGGRLVRPVDSATPAPTVLIGSEKQPNHAPAPYAPIAESHSALVTNEEEREPFRPVKIGPERGEASSARQQPPARPAASPTPIPSANRAPGQPVIQSTAPPARPTPGAAEAGAQAAAATPGPTLPARYNLGTSLGTPVPASGPTVGPAVSGDDAEVLSGPIDSVRGDEVVIRTETGPRRIQLADQARLEREGRGRVEDLRPGEVVGVIQAPGGPATTVRLYSKGPGMPQPGMVPMIGEQLGQVTTFGTIVALRGGGIVVNTGDATTPIELPGGVEVLKPLKAAPADLKVGMPVTAAGSVTGDGVLVASSVRMTSEGPLAR